MLFPSYLPFLHWVGCRVSSSLSLWNQMNQSCRQRPLCCQAGDSWARSQGFKAAGPTVILAGPMLGPSQETDFRRGWEWGFDPLPWRMARESSRKLEQELGPRLMLIKIDNSKMDRSFHAPSSGCQPGLMVGFRTYTRLIIQCWMNAGLHRQDLLPVLNLPYSSLLQSQEYSGSITDKKGVAWVCWSWVCRL